MSTTSHHQSSPGEAPWKSTFLAHVSKLPSPEFVIATLHEAPSSSPTPLVPRLRYCLFRGMWAQITENKHNQAPQNERIYESDLPTLTTDVRMLKIGELFGSSDGHASDEKQTQGSGGGGAVEAVWWIKEEATQWRMKGEAFVVAPDIEGEGEQSSGVRTVKSKVGARMRKVKEGDWSWGKELTAHFGNVRPEIRGSFRNPAPGTPVAKVHPDENHWLGQKVEDLHDPVARENFRVVIITPEEVEQLYLGDPGKSRRWKYTYVAASEDDGEDKGQGKWEKEELWP
ncbi:hypothetical protein MMC07_009958 [Pseudocyphellaria aurata]|nr:hypothetical protein [Pseudocyphellaria aurata]